MSTKGWKWQDHLSRLSLDHGTCFCEWLDMGPIDTASTDIEEVIILRKARRLGANFREGLSTVAGRAAAREAFVRYYDAHPLDAACFGRIVDHMRTVYPENVELDEQTVLQRGFF